MSAAYDPASGRLHLFRRGQPYRRGTAPHRGGPSRTVPHPHRGLGHQFRGYRRLPHALSRGRRDEAFGSGDLFLFAQGRGDGPAHPGRLSVAAGAGQYLPQRGRGHRRGGGPARSRAVRLLPGTRVSRMRAPARRSDTALAGRLRLPTGWRNAGP